MACRECHIAKVKCDKVIPCSRCVRLSKVCVRHESRQGQGRNKKRARTKVSEDAAIGTEIGGSLKPNHYGLQYLIRSWVALAMRRRNFGLLSRAGMIADRSGISMDQIFCESGTRRGMDFLYSLLLTPAPNQVVLGDRLSWNEVPHQMLVATGCVGATDALNDPIVGDRWIWIREIRNGISRYLVTPAFDRDIADWNLIQQTYQENKKSVVELFLNPPEIGKHTKAFAHQISLHATPDLPPKSSRMKSKVKVKTNNNSSSSSSSSNTNNSKRGSGATTTTTLECDQIFCLQIMNLDHDFCLQEYVPRVPVDNNNNNNDSKPSAVGSSSSSSLFHQQRLLNQNQNQPMPQMNLSNLAALSSANANSNSTINAAAAAISSLASAGRNNAAGGSNNHNNNNNPMAAAQALLSGGGGNNAMGGGLGAMQGLGGGGMGGFGSGIPGLGGGGGLQGLGGGGGLSNNNNNSNPANHLNNQRITQSEVNADAAFKSGLDLGLPLLDLDNFDDDADLDFFMNVLK